MHEKRLDFSWWEDNKKMTIINWEAESYIFGTPGKKKVIQKFRLSLDQKAKAI